MPAGFDKCMRDGGRVRTIVPKKGTYFRVCWINGKSYRGEIKHDGKKKNIGKAAKKVVGRKKR